jgi:ER membrane protein complex subunit 1
MYILSSLWTASLLFFCTLSTTSVWALHESEAGVVDWQKTFIGVPRTDGPQVAPSFLRVKGKGNDTKSLIISASETTLGAVDPVDGNVGERGLKR